jgi:hypothetical protein
MKLDLRRVELVTIVQETISVSMDELEPALADLLGGK